MDREKPILVVDDIQPVRETIINILKILGYSNFLEASNGKEAMDLIQSNKEINLIISDWKMPVMNGLELLRWVRSNPNTKDIPFLFITSKGEKEDIAQAAEEKVTDYIVKPIDVKTFIEKINNIENQKNGHIGSEDSLKSIKKLIEKGEYKKADEKIDQILSSSKPKPSLLVEIAKLYPPEIPEKPLELLKKAIAINPIYTEAWIFMADLYTKCKKYEEAIDALKKAYEINPNSPKILYRLGRLYLLTNNLHKAKDYFLMGLNADPQNENMVQDIWNLYLKLGLVDRVLKDFEHILFERLSVKTLNNLAVALRKKGNIKEAIKAYRQALKKEPENEHIHYNISIAYLDTKREDMAIQHLEKAIKINPDFEKAVSLLNKIKKQTKGES